MLLNLLVASPFTLVATVFAVCLAHALLNRGHWRRAWQELCTTDWWSLSLGLLMPAAAAESGWTCEACGAPAHLRCSRCMAVRYCCLDCQRRHWRAGHKSECGTQRVKLSPEELEARRAELDAKLPEPFPAAERLLYSYDKFLQFFQHPKLFLPSEIAGSPVGFFNVGNTCYANAVLQCLFATPSFSAFLHEFGRWKSYHKSEGAGEDPFTQGATWSLLSELCSLLTVASSSVAPVSPKPLLGRINRIGRHLTFGRQEDSHDFFLTLLDAIEAELLQLAAGKEAVQDIRTRETTFVYHAFGGYMRNQVICSECGYRSKKFESTICLSLEIPGHISTLKGALDLHCAEEALDGLNKYQCDCCRNKVRAVKSSLFEVAPNVLVLALKRFSVGRFGKLNKKVSFPATLDISDLCAEGSIDPSPSGYTLYGVVVHLNHMNSTMYGHYVAYVKSEDQRWYLCDDSQVTQVSPSKVYNQSAYMLFYTRDVDAPKPQPMVKEPAPEALFLPNGDTYSSPGHRSKPEHPVPTPEGGACEPSSRPMDWHAFAHCAPRAMIERTFSSPAALVRRGNAMGSCSPGSQDSPNGLPVVSTSSSGSLDGELCPATKDTASYSLMGPGAVGTLGDGLVAEVADRLAEDLMLASRPGSGSLKDRCPEHTEAMAVQEEVEPSYEIRTIQDHAGGAQLLKLIVDLPGIKAQDVDLAIDDAGSILPDAPGSSCFAGSSYLSITVIGKYFLRLPLPPGVMTSEHPAKYNSRSGRLKMTLVGTAQPDEVGAGGLGEGAGGNLSGPVPASTTEDIRLQPQKCRGRSSSCNDLETFNSSQGYEKDEV